MDIPGTMNNIFSTFSRLTQKTYVSYGSDLVAGDRHTTQSFQSCYEEAGFGFNMRVKLAAQIISHPVSYAIKTPCKLNFRSNGNLQSALKRIL